LHFLEQLLEHVQNIFADFFKAIIVLTIIQAEISFPDNKKRKL